MSQSFACQKCGAQVPVENAQHHPKTGDRFYVCPNCGAKNRVVQAPTPIGAPLRLEPSGLIDDES